MWVPIKNKAVLPPVWLTRHKLPVHDMYANVAGGSATPAATPMRRTPLLPTPNSTPAGILPHTRPTAQPQKYTGADHPSPYALTQLQTELLSTRDQLKTVQGELAALKEQQQELWAQHQEATTAADSAKSALAAAQRQVAVLEAQVVPLQREREGLARLVDVLQQGLADQAAGAHSSSQPQSTVGDTSDAVVAGVTSERVQLLEQAVKDLTSQQELLQEQYKAAGQAEAQQRQRADAAERSAAALERQVEALSQQCAQQQVSQQCAQQQNQSAVCPATCGVLTGLVRTVSCALVSVDTMASSGLNVQWGVMPWWPRHDIHTVHST